MGFASGAPAAASIYTTAANLPTTAPGGQLAYVKDAGQFRAFVSSPVAGWYNLPTPNGLKPTGPQTCAFETVPRQFANITDQAQPTVTSGALWLASIDFPYNTTITGVTFVSGATAMTAGTHLWAAWYDVNLNLLAQSVDNLIGAWAGGTQKQFLANVVPVDTIVLQSGTTYRYHTTIGHGYTVGSTIASITAQNMTPTAYGNGVAGTAFVTSNVVVDANNIDINVGSNPGALTIPGTIVRNTVTTATASLVYCGLMQVGGARPSLASVAGLATTNGSVVTPILVGSCATAGLTTQAATTSGALTATANTPYFYFTP